MKRNKILFVVLIIFLTLEPVGCVSLDRSVPSPKEVLGYEVGEKYCLTYWQQELDYFEVLAETSPRAEVMQWGSSTNGKPMILVIVSSQKNLKRLEEYKAIVNKLSDSRELSESEARVLSEEGKPIVFLNCDIHSDEYEDSESAMEFAWRLATAKDERTSEILDNVILIINPSINPDGHDWYRRWYDRYKKTQYAGTSPPYYHEYVSHDLNRDWHEGNTKEIRQIWRVFLEWKPQVFIDNHMMGSKGYRMFISPECDPINPNISPLIQSQKFLLAGHILSVLQRNNCSGVQIEEQFDLFFPGYGDSWPSLHNSIGSTWEIAGGDGADPIYIEFEELSAGAKSKGEHQLDPWEGGYWPFEDQAKYRLVAWYALLEAVSKFKEDVLLNFYLANKEQTEKGLSEEPCAYLVPKDQNDPCTLAKMLNKLIGQGVEVRVSEEKFVLDGAVYPKGTFVVLMAQPYRAMAKTLLERQVLEIHYTYDVTSWTYGLAKGIEVIETSDKRVQEINLSNPLEKVFPPPGKVLGNKAVYYAFNHTNSGIRAVNELLDRKKSIYLVSAGFSSNIVDFEPGTFVMEADELDFERVQSLANEFNLTIFSVSETLSLNYRLNKPNIGLYYPHRDGILSMDEGWTRLVLEEFGFDFERISDAKMNNLDEEDLDVIIIPNEWSVETLIGGAEDYPLENGIGEKGVEELESFVKDGGTLVLWGNTGQIITNFKIRPRIGVRDETEVKVSGTFLDVVVDEPDFITYGLPDRFSAFFAQPPVYRVRDAFVLAEFAKSDLVASGCAEGVDALKSRAAIIKAPLGEGSVVVFSFLPQYRASVDNTYTLLFNSLFCSSVEN